MNRIKAPHSAEISIKNSKFIAYLFPIADVAEAETRLAQVKREHPKARHWCYAYRLGAEDENVQKIITVGADWHKDHLAGNRPMFEAIDAKFLKENLPDQLAAYQACNPAPDVDKMAASLKAMWLDERSSGYPNEAVRKIKAPVLAIRGETDFLYAFADWAALAGELPDVHLMSVPFAAHEAMKEQPEMVWAAVKAFFQVA